MANVLPPQSQKKLWRMYRARFIVALSLVLIALSFCGYLALIPGYLALRIAAPPAQNTPKPGATTESATDIARAQTLILALAQTLSATTSPSALIGTALEDKPKGVAVDHISYNEQENTIVLSGSGSRENINAYRDIVSKHTEFSQVSVPVSALVGDGGNFSMKITLAQIL